LIFGGYRYWIFVTNDYHSSAVQLEWEQRQKATVETGMAELKTNFGLNRFRKHAFMANWAWLLIVCLGSEARIFGAVGASGQVGRRAVVLNVAKRGHPRRRPSPPEEVIAAHGGTVRWGAALLTQVAVGRSVRV
jgi:hypothetical protein